MKNITNLEIATGLETLSPGVANASHYWDWVYEEMAPYLGNRILEIGPGFGNLAQRIIRSNRDYSAIDLDPTVITQLRQNVHAPKESLIIGDITDTEIVKQLSSMNPDTIISMNVLEHVDDERAHLRALTSISPSFRFILFVPALSFLYGRFDREAGHFRRYTRKGLTGLLQEIGAHTIHIRYFNALGAFAWFLAGRVFQCPLRGEGTSDSIVWFDRWIIPMAQFIDPFVRRFLGQSLLTVAEIGPVSVNPVLSK